MSDLLQRIWTEGTPLIDGDTVTFAWYGEDPPLLRGDFNDWGEERTPEWQRLRKGRTRRKGQALPVWLASMSFPQDAYIEYCFGPDDARVADPFNKRRITNGYGQFNHWFRMPESHPTGLTRRRPRVPHGRVTRHDLATEGLVAGTRRRVYLYQPPTEEPSPLLLVYDGNDYRRRGRLVAIVDNLIAARRIRPLALVMVHHGGQRARFLEYTCSESALYFVLHQLLPLAREQLSLVEAGLPGSAQPGPHGVLGASAGGLMALFTGLRLGHIFGSVLTQSGFFHADDYASVVNDLVLAGAASGLRVWMDVGRYEHLLHSSRTMHQQLLAQQVDVTYREYNGGHNYTCWRDDIAHGLETLFPWNDS